MTISDQWGANRGLIHMILCVVAIIAGVLMYANAWHVGADHKAIGAVEFTVGLLLLV